MASCIDLPRIDLVAFDVVRIDLMPQSRSIPVPAIGCIETERKIAFTISHILSLSYPLLAV